MRERLLADILVLAIVAVMVGAAELSGQSEIIFPEITAIAVGAFLAPRLAWRTDRIRVLVTVSLCAVLGVLLVRYVPLPVWGRLTLAYGLAQVVFLLSGTRFAPMISAIALPVLLGTESWVYPAAAFLLTGLILLCHWGLERLGLREELRFSPIRPAAADWRAAGLRLALAAPVIWAALALYCRFAVAPPLLVAFTEFSSPTAAARKRPFRAGAAIGLCALAGTVSRLLIQGALGLPLILAALLAAAAMIAILRSLGMYVPPAGALAILPMLLPAERLPRYPLQIALGTALFLALAITVFRERKEPISR